MVTEERKPWAFIAHRDGKWSGVASAELPKKDLRKYLGDWVVSGCEITTVYSREEYDAALAQRKK